MQSHYRVNVALNGRHFFATAPNSLTSLEDAQRVAPVLRAKFPKSEGYSVSVTYWRCHGEEVDL